MFGATLVINHDGKVVILRAVKKDEIPLIAEKMSSSTVLRFLGRDMAGITVQQEEDWYKRTSEDESSVVWGIEYEGKLIGNTSIHNLSAWSVSCTTGVVIFEPDCWGKGLTRLIHPTCQCYGCRWFLIGYSIV